MAARSSARRGSVRPGRRRGPARRRPLTPLDGMPVTPTLLFLLVFPTSARAAEPALFLRAVAPPVQETPPADDGPCCRPQRRSTDPASLPSDRKSVLLRAAAQALFDSNAPFVGMAPLRENEAKFAQIGERTPLETVYAICFQLGEARLQEGEIDGAIAAYERCLAIAKTLDDRDAQLGVMRRLALSEMRRGERANCVAHHNSDSCIFPLRGGALHVEPAGSKKAIALLSEILETLAPGDLNSIWLLNIAHMTLGTYPEGVPPKWRIDPKAFESEHPLPRMVDVAVKKGLRIFARSGGAAVDDFDLDGRLDVVVSSSDPDDSLRMFRQKGDGTFEEVTAEKGLTGQLGGLNFLHFDANNDGRLDLLVQRGAWLGPAGKVPNSLLIQQADGTFLDRTLEAGIETAAPSQVAVTADVDNDGDLDLFLGYESLTGPGGTEFPSRMFKNRGDGTFEDVTRQAGVQNHRFCKGAAFGDYDGDRLPDLYVSNMGAPNRLYRNQGDGSFKDVALAAGVAEPKDSFATWFFDYDNDGDLDLYVTCYAMGARSAELCAFYKDGKAPSDSQRLYENVGSGRFQDVTKERGLARPLFPMGSNFGDVDNDGFPDLYLGTGDPDFTSLWPSILFHNDGGRRFQDVTTATGTGHLQKGHGVCFADVDGDGDQDLFEELGGAVRDDAFQAMLFENPGHSNHWLTVRVVGHQTNRFGVGVRLRATIEEGAGTRSIVTFVGGNSSFGGNSLQAELGLGQAKQLRELEVFWPTTGKTDLFKDVPLDRIVVVEEGKGWRLAPAP